MYCGDLGNPPSKSAVKFETAQPAVYPTKVGMRERCSFGAVGLANGVPPVEPCSCRVPMTNINGGLLLYISFPFQLDPF